MNPSLPGLALSLPSGAVSGTIEEVRRMGRPTPTNGCLGMTHPWCHEAKGTFPSHGWGGGKN